MASAIHKKAIAQTLKVLRAHNGNVTNAAADLGLARSTVQSRIAAAARLGIKVEDAATREERTNSQLLRDNAKLKAEIGRLKSVKKVVWRQSPSAKGPKGDTVTFILPDVHGMYADQNAIGVVIRDIRSAQPDHIIQLGDFIDCGGFLAQHHTMGYVAQLGYSWEQDIAAANSLLDAIQAAAPRANIEMLQGNHDERVERWCVTEALKNCGSDPARDAEALRTREAPEFRMNLEARGIRYYRRSVFYDGLSIPGAIKRGNTYYVHTAADGSDLTGAHLNKFAGNVVFGHCHRAMSRTGFKVSTGEIGAWSFGTLSMKQPLWQHSKPTEWTNGYGVRLESVSGHFQMLSIPIIGESDYLSRVARLGGAK